MVSIPQRVSATIVFAAAVLAVGLLLAPLRCAADGTRACSDCGDARRSDEPIDSAPTLVKPDCTSCTGGWCRLQPGTFRMGAPFDEPTRAAFSEDPVDVTLTHAFEIAQYELTVEEWRALGLPLSALQTSCTSDRCPVEVSWYDAMNAANLKSASHVPPLAPCYALSDCAAADGGKGTVCTGAVETGPLYDCPGYRLPTEAEWEFACRAGTKTAFYDGPVTVTAVAQPRLLLTCYDEPKLAPIAWYCTNSANSPHAVGGKWPNPWCLHEMLGNVSEWTSGGYDGQPYGNSPQTDPGSSLGSFTRRVTRGGPYFGAPVDATCFARSATIPGIPLSGTGLRLVRTLAPSR